MSIVRPSVLRRGHRPLGASPTRACAGLIVFCLLLAPGAAETGVYTIKFRCWPTRSVTATIGTDSYDLSQPVVLNYALQGTNDKIIVIFRRPGFHTAQCEITSSQAQACAGVYPPPPEAPITLQPESLITGLLTWAQERPWLALLWIVASLVIAPALLWRGWRSMRARAELHQRLAQYDEQRDRSDSVLLTSVEGYVLVEKLGQGGMATVYKGVPAGTLDESRAVAVKMLGRHLFENPEFQRRFNREVSAYQRLDHPNIVRLLSWRELDASGEAPYVILELVAGQTISSLIPPRGMSWQQARPILEQVFAAVEYAHGRGVVHRDLKPDNIMVSQGRAKVMDFGLARDQNASQLTVSGTILGTPAYMAPEQLGQNSSDPAVDQYALGVVAYRMLSGRLPHESEDLMQLFNKVLVGKPTPLREYRPDLPAKLEEAVMRMLSRQPQDRYPSVAQAWSALQ